jgi:hypothetical protein
MGRLRESMTNGLRAHPGYVSPVSFEEARRKEFLLQETGLGEHGSPQTELGSHTTLKAFLSCNPTVPACAHHWRKNTGLQGKQGREVWGKCM